jgi:hypothetical protein
MGTEKCSGLLCSALVTLDLHDISICCVMTADTSVCFVPLCAGVIAGGQHSIAALAAGTLSCSAP